MGQINWMSNGNRVLPALLIAAAALIAGCAGMPDATAPEGVNLSGSWMLNSDLSDKPSGPGRGPERRGGPPPMHTFPILPPAEMTIQQSVGALQIEDSGSTTRYVYGEKAVVSVPNGVADRRTGWRGKRFVVELKSPAGMNSLRTYELDKTGARLIVTATADGRKAMKRVYDRAEALRAQGRKTIT